MRVRWWRGISASMRALLALAVCFGAHLALREPVEGLRVRILGLLLSPFSGFAAAADPDLLAPSVERLESITAWRAARTERLGGARRAVIPVLDYRPRSSELIVGAGRATGVAVGDAVFAEDGLIGFVDRTEAHLARVRLMAAAGNRVAVTLAESRPGLPGGIARLAAVLEGSGTAVHLVEGSLLRSFRPGDRLVTCGGEGDHATPAGVPVAEVTMAGPRPQARLFADPVEAGFVSVVGRDADAAPPHLFSEARLRVAAAPLIEGSAALLIGPGVRDAAPGSAVVVGKRYLGRVIRTAGTAAVASRLGDRGHDVAVRWFSSSGADGGGVLVCEGFGRFRFEGRDAPAGIESGVLAVTAGGQGLVPADLFVGILIPEGGRFVLSDAPAVWPASVTVPVFVFDEELRHLPRRRKA